jgi:hypothetical protein
MSPMHPSVAHHLVADRRAALEAVASHRRLRGLIRRRPEPDVAGTVPAPTPAPALAPGLVPSAAPSPVELTLASYRAERRRKDRVSTVA